MGEWNGKWKSSGHIKCQCQCGTPNGAETSVFMSTMY